MGTTIAVMELLFPPHCLFCEEIKPFRGDCPHCVALEQKYRLKDGSKLNYLLEKRAANNLSKTISSYIYSNDTADMVARYKFQQHYTMARDMAKIIATDIIELLGEDCCDVVLPVPAYKKSTNQHSALIAKRVAKILSKPYLPEALVKEKKTKPQHELSAEERAKNLAGAFAVKKPNSVKNKRVLLCDDVMTSGNTLNECARVLLDAGALEVLAATFSTTTAGDITFDDSKEEREIVVS